MTTVEVLEAARERIANGWTQGESVTLRPGGYAYCATGAISVGRPDHVDRGLCVVCVARNVFRKAIGAEPLVAWNDRPGRTQAEVLDAFDRAIALARSAS